MSYGHEAGEAPRYPTYPSNDAMIEAEVVPFANGNQRIIQAFRTVDRRDFVPQGQEDGAYSSGALTLIPGWSSISRPSMQACLMHDLFPVEENDQEIQRILEIGGASGYGAALLQAYAPDAEVHTVEYDEYLATAAAVRLRSHGFRRVRVHIGDGTLGFQERAPYDRILVTAGAKELPQALADQLAEGGIIVVPVGNKRPNDQQLIIGKKDKGEVITSVSKIASRVVFVPLVSSEHGGWREEELVNDAADEYARNDALVEKHMNGLPQGWIEIYKRDPRE